MAGPQRPPVPAAGIRVLAVDDEPDMLFLTKAFLEHAFVGLTVAGAADGPQALALLARQRFDAVVSDYRMPGMDGFEFLRRAVPPMSPGRCILMTAYADKALQDRARAAGLRFVEKAGDPENIVEAMRALLDEARALPAGPRAPLG
jgi:CheY-like chemotaxis protein